MKTLVTLLLAISLNTQASQTDITAIEQAAMSLDTQQLTILVEQNSGYEKAFALYNLSIAKNLHAEQEQATKSLDSAISELENLTEQTPNDDEVRALLALTYGLKTVYQPMKAADYGPKSGQALAKALSLNQNNPRAYLVKGISKYNTPAMYGGSKTAALTALDQAIALYSQEFEQGNSSDKVWGEANAHVWRGLANISLNNKSQALTDWHNALAISPNFGWAKMLIQQNQ
ncbi:MAG: hypothetical protein JKY81_09535 [Colwellia sp.]|nr:hypothetical protein [Colwellia sp.]